MCFIFLGNLGMLIQVVSEVQFIIIPCVPKMNMIRTACGAHYLSKRVSDTKLRSANARTRGTRMNNRAETSKVPKRRVMSDKRKEAAQSPI